MDIPFPSVILECVHVDNIDDADWISSEENRRSVGVEIAGAILMWLNQSHIQESNHARI
jgi:N-acetylmuramoyl-L-alanine amidase